MLQVRGVVTTSFQIGSDTCTEEFLVADHLREDLVLGQPWLQKQQAVLDIYRGCIHYGLHRRRTLFWRTNRSRPRSVKTTVSLETKFPPEYQADVQELWRDFPEVFREDPERFVTTLSTTHEIRLRDSRPFRLSPYRYSPAKKQFILAQVEDMLANGIISPSRSAYCSPIVIVQKKGGDQRFCIDYRKLNKVTEDEASSLPIINETLRDLGNAKVFSTLDLKSGYWQVPLSPETRPLTAFTTPDGSCYEFNVMPFGLKNAPMTFQKLMTQEVLAGLLRKFVLVYLDDIIIYSNSWSEHLDHLRQVLERLQQHRLHCSVPKCRIGAQELTYLGHHVSQNGNAPTPEYLDIIKATAVPTSIKQLRHFLGMVNWLRDYLPRCAEICAPLTDLLKGRQKWRWSSEAQEAYSRLQIALTKPLLLHRPDFQKDFTLQTDASSKGVAAVLLQELPEGRRVISYASAKLTPTEQKYHCNEQECLAVIWACKKFRPYLEDRPFTLKTDSRALLWLDRGKEATSKLTRWSLLLQEFNFNVIHCAGRDNELPDVLSRNPADRLVPTEVTDTDRLLPPTSYNIRLQQLEIEDVAAEVEDAQQVDPSTWNLVDRWRRIDNEGPTELGDNVFYRLYDASSGCLKRTVEGNLQQMVVPSGMKQRLLYKYHDHGTAGHPGAEETARAILRHYYWPRLRQDVKRYVRGCLICNYTKRGPLQPRAPQRPHHTSQPWETIAVDLMGPYIQTRSGNRFILTVTDLCTQWVEAFPCGHTRDRMIVRLLENEVFNRYGYPKSILSDNGPQFRSRTWDAAIREWGVQHWTTPIFHPRANPDERRNQEIKKGIRARVTSRNRDMWDKLLPQVLFTLRTRKNAATGTTPSYALLGYELPRPGDWHIHDHGPSANNVGVAREQRIHRVHQNQHRYRGRYIINQSVPVRYQLGDLVMTRAHPSTTNDFPVKWTGPHEVIEIAGPVAYWIDRAGEPAKVHVDDLRQAPPPQITI